MFYNEWQSLILEGFLNFLKQDCLACNNLVWQILIRWLRRLTHLSSVCHMNTTNFESIKFTVLLNQLPTVRQGRGILELWMAFSGVPIDKLGMTICPRATLKNGCVVSILNC